MIDLSLSSQTPPTPAPPPPPAPAPAPTDDIQLGETALKLAYTLVGEDSIRFKVTFDSLAWIGFGLSQGETEPMTGGGEGSDVVLCSEGKVTRRWVTAKGALP